MKSGKAPFLLSKVRRYSRAESLFEPGDTVIVMISGGPDSTALLDVLTRLGGSPALKLVGLHCNHGLRDMADHDEGVAVAQAESYGIPVTVRRLDVGSAAAERGLGIEEAARFLRYQAARELAAAVGAGKIATGHTADDVAEWQLMCVIRGTSIAGLSGMSPKGQDGLVRPILCATKQEILIYLRDNKLEYVIDETNSQDRFLRSRVRSRLMPLVREMNPSFAQTALATAELLRLDARFIDRLYEEWRHKNITSYSDAGVLIALTGGDEVPAALLVRAVFTAAASLWPSLRLGSAAVLTVVGLAREGAVGARVNLGAGLLAYLEPSGLVISCAEEGVIEESELEPGRESELGPAGTVSVTYVIDRPGSLASSAEVAVADAGRFNGSLRVRSWRGGDSFVPLGMSGSKKLQDFFVDAKVPRRVRSRIPIFTDGEKIVWVGGYRLDDRVKVTARTSRYALMRWRRNSD